VKARAFTRAKVKNCPFYISLLSRFVVEDNSVSPVAAFVPACGCQRTR
jgi:hypothetical protein